MENNENEVIILDNAPITVLDHVPAGQFSKYNKQFQEKILQGLLTDHAWAAQMVEVMRFDFFELVYLRFLCEKYFNYFFRYRCFPTTQLLVSIVKESFQEENDDLLKTQVIDFLHRMKKNPHPGDVAYVKEKILDFCKRQAFKEALEKSVELISEDKFDHVLTLMKNIY